MRVYISVDLEGVAGIVHRDQCRRGGGGYEEARALMTAEANAAAQGAFDGGAEQVLLNDSHGDMRNLILEALDPRVEVITGALKPFSMIQGIHGHPGGGRYDVALFVGYHGGAGTAAAILDHTYRGAVVSQVRIDGRPFNEAGINALVAGQVGTPVAMVSGDASTCEQCREILGPQLETVTVKWAIGRMAAHSLHPIEARRRISEGAARAVRRAGTLQPFALPGAPPHRLELDVIDTAMADAAAIMPGAERPGPRTLAYRAGDIESLFRALLTMIKLGATTL
ncbi:MAG: M55 family metallopeptidase [Myxococcales bacterium]|nr:M55 family metallopeptidase [Myxococcales bacterium]